MSALEIDTEPRDCDFCPPSKLHVPDTYTTNLLCHQTVNINVFTAVTVLVTSLLNTVIHVTLVTSTLFLGEHLATLCVSNPNLYTKSRVGPIHAPIINKTSLKLAFRGICELAAKRHLLVAM